MQRHERLHERRGEAARDVPEQEAHPAESVFDVVAEDPQEEHVEDDVLPASVHEHGGEGIFVPRDVRLQGESDARSDDLARESVVDDVCLDGRTLDSQIQTIAFTTMIPTVTTGNVLVGTLSFSGSMARES